MSESKLRLSDEARSATGAAWFEYLQLVDPFRPDLFRYCRKLTGDVWDAEDLVQDTLEQGFAKLGSVHHTIQKPRAYMLRIASNIWVDKVRRASSETAALAKHAAEVELGGRPDGRPDESIEVRDATAALMRRLAPQERAALVLKDVFGLSLEETASVLATTVGAIKAALHRGRKRLEEPMQSKTRGAPPGEDVIDRFVACYNSRDLPGMLALLLDDASIEMPGHVLEIGRDGFEREKGWLHHNFYNPVDGSPSSATWEVSEFDGVPIVLVWGEHEEGRVLDAVMRLETNGNRVSRVRTYVLCPDVVAEVASSLEVPSSPYRMYRFPFPMSGD